MTDPQTPATEAGQRLWLRSLGGNLNLADDILAIEAEARHQGYDESKAIIGAAKTEASRRIREARADALREAADAVRALRLASPTLNAVTDYVAAVLAILDPQP